MAFSYLSVDREQQFLLPPSVRDWLPEGHLAWFVLEVLDRLDTSVLHARHPNDGVGRRAYDPDMLLGLLVYSYCTGVRSSRQIERLCEVDVAYRVICANHVPDHTTIARFRQEHEQHAVQLFTDVLVLCVEAGLGTVGVVAVDGTKIGSDAALRANRSRDAIEAEVRTMFAEAAEVDATQDELFGQRRGDELPDELVDPRSRRARLDAALQELEAQRQARVVAEDAAQAAKIATYRERAELAARAGKRPDGNRPAGVDPVAEAAATVALEQAREVERAQRRAELEARCLAEGRKPKGPKPSGRPHRDLVSALQRLERAKANPAVGADTADKDLKVNVTDPQSRIMKTTAGWVQGYNAQAAVNEHGIVLAAAVTQDGFDVHQCQPMMTLTALNAETAGIAEPIGTMLLDAGYCSEDNICAEGPDRLIATTKSWKLRRQQAAPPTGEPAVDASPIEKMQHRLCSDEGAALYAKRQHIVEPVFGDIKENRGFRRFVRRGFSAAQGEWLLMTAAHNLRKLHRHAPA